MARSLENAYFEWLCSQIHPQGVYRERSFDSLYRLLHEREFVWSRIMGDENRCEDGMALLAEFLNEAHTLGAEFLSGNGCSVLEVIIGLSRRLAWIAEPAQEVWAWQLIENLGLQKMWDPLSPVKADRAQEILDQLIWRTYRPDGVGGFFPLERPDHDQTQVEIWYQMHAYIEEVLENA